MAGSKKILVVDDNHVNRAILCKILKTDGYQPIEAENGRSALDILRDPTQVVSLVLLDITMPVMDGYELLDEMTKSGIITRVPVMMTTGAEDERAEVRCLEHGASDFLKKPYNVEMVRHRVHSILRLWDNAALISRLETDQLTGVYNKEFFYQYAEEILDKHPKDAYSIVYADVDDFKMINARYGAAAGDELLKYLAAVFQRTVGKDGSCGRIGGDIFVLLLKKRSRYTQAQVEAQLDAAFKDAPVKGFQLKFGVYPIKDRSIAVIDMCDRAKLAVTTVKHQYRMHYAIYDDSMMDHALREHQLADCMEDALENKQFAMYLQPKHDTQAGAVAGAEALVRWNHPSLGFISPGEFIPLFERNGFITKLDEYMLRTVCQTLADWVSRGITPIPISVNMSRADFASDDLPEQIANCVDAFRLPHELIYLEVTESAYTNDPQQMISAVSTLRDMGFLVEMDDFGSGYSSLNMLSELPIDVLKLDMRFMQSDNDRISGGKRNILSFIVSLSKWLQLPTIAEGVETQTEFELLKSMGCNYIQGYFFSKPMAAEAFVGYMEEHREGYQKKDIAVPCELLPSKTETVDGEKPLILVVEDIESNRELIKTLLLPSYRIVEAVNGKEACEYLMAHHGEISCVTLDLLMPIMDGFQVLEFMRENAMIHEVPVVITTENGSNSELRALHLGASSFVGKPYNPEILIHHVMKAVEEREFWKFRKEFEFQKNALYEKAYMDELTGLLNRHGLKEAITRLAPAECFAAIMLDIDNLKQINDTKGHDAGDKTIRTVAELLKTATRNGDVLARVGGDEFVVLLRGMDDAETAFEKGERLCATMKSEGVEAAGVLFSCSAGITLACQSEAFSKITKRADAGLYRAKSNHKGGCCLWPVKKGAEFKSKAGASI